MPCFEIVAHRPVVPAVLAATALLILTASPATVRGQDDVRSSPVRGYVQSSASMMPALAIGDWVLVDVRAQPEVGDVVVYEPPVWPAEGERLPVVKRVIARGGDRVSMRGGVLRVNGRALQQTPCVPPEPVVKLQSVEVAVECNVERSVRGKEYRVIRARGEPAMDFDEVQVPPENFFVLGDFRDHSADSRVYGPIPARSVLGVAKRIYNSTKFSRIGRGL